MLEKLHLGIDRRLLKCWFSSMKDLFVPRRLVMVPRMVAMVAVILLPGCADFWRVKRPVATGAADIQSEARPPVPPLPTPVPPPEPPPPLPRPDPPSGPRPTAIPVPGKPGFVFSPYNNKVIDVQDFTAGTLVADPTYPVSERKFFRVP